MAINVNQSQRLEKFDLHDDATKSYGVVDGAEVRIETPLDQFLIALAKEIVQQETPDTLLHKLKTYVNKSAGFGLDSRKLEDLLTGCSNAVVADMKEQTKY